MPGGNTVPAAAQLVRPRLAPPLRGQGCSSHTTESSISSTEARVSALPWEPAQLVQLPYRVVLKISHNADPKCERSTTRQKGIDRHKLVHKLARPGGSSDLLGRLDAQPAWSKAHGTLGLECWPGHPCPMPCPLDTHFLPLIPHKTEVCAHCLADPPVPSASHLCLPGVQWALEEAQAHPSQDPQSLCSTGTSGRLHRFTQQGRTA